MIRDKPIYLQAPNGPGGRLALFLYPRAWRP